MTSIKNPQTVSHKNNKSGGSGFTSLLLLITWAVIGAGFYGVKTGMIQPEEANPAVNEKISALDSKVSAIDTRLVALEKRLSDASSALNPAAPTETIVKPEEVKPVAPAAPATPEEKKPEGGAAAPTPADPILSAPKEEENPKQPENGSAATKPQTNKGKNNTDDQAGLIEKKSHI